MEGKSTVAVAKYLTAQGIPTPSGKTNWHCSVIESILTNEKYKGDALLQKSFTVDFLSKKQKINQGEVPQFYVANSHEAIILPDEFEQVQVEMRRRKELGKSYRGVSCFSSKILCGDCGSFYGSSMAQHIQIPPKDMAMQSEVQKRSTMRNSAPYGR
jgi:site-specific DNA recombinase